MGIYLFVRSVESNGGSGVNAFGQFWDTLLIRGWDYRSNPSGTVGRPQIAVFLNPGREITQHVSALKAELKIEDLFPFPSGSWLESAPKIKAAKEADSPGPLPGDPRGRGPRET